MIFLYSLCNTHCTKLELLSYCLLLFFIVADSFLTCSKLLGPEIPAVNTSKPLLSQEALAGLLSVPSSTSSSQSTAPSPMHGSNSRTPAGVVLPPRATASSSSAAQAAGHVVRPPLHSAPSNVSHSDLIATGLNSPSFA